METAVKIRSNQQLASTHTQGKCDVMRVILSNNRINNEEGIYIKRKIHIKSRYFKEQTININGTDVTERLYVSGSNLSQKDHERVWEYSKEELDNVISLMAQQMGQEVWDAIPWETQQLHVFIALSNTAGEDNGGWEGMNTYSPDTPHKVVNKFTEIEE